MKCDELKPLVFSISDLSFVDEPTPQPNFQNPHDHAVYKATEVDKVLAQKDKEIAKLKEEVNNLLMQNRELCQALQVMYSAEEYTKLQNKNAELKQKLENVQESMYADVVDANMENRRLRRALWIAHAYKAKFKRLWLHLELDYEGSKIRPDTKTIKRIMGKIKNCEKSERKCLKKAKEYK